MEYRLRRFGGAYRWVLGNGKPFGRGGSFAGYFGCCIDIHDRKEIEAANALMVSELNHRVRNNLASIKGLINPTSKTAETTGVMTRILRSRVEGLALAHTVLAQHGWQPVSVMALTGHIADCQMFGRGSSLPEKTLLSQRKRSSPWRRRCMISTSTPVSMER